MRIACIRFGSRLARLGAASAPAIAPSIAASPHPSPSIHGTRTPTRRASAGFVAAARSARPIFVNRKKSQRATTVPIETPIVPTSWTEIATPPTSNVRVGNGLCRLCWEPRPDPGREAVEHQQQPDRDDHDAEHGASLDRSDHELVDAEAAGERDERG